jgi:hypothetical protein
MTITINRRTVTVAAFALVAAAILAGCTGSKPKADSAQVTGQNQTEQAFKQQQTAVPYPVNQLKDSLERRNVRERLLRYNNPNKISYIYLLSQTGAVITSYTIKGKVSSSNSQLTTDTIVQDCTGWQTPCRNNVTAPGDDGTYGPNENGIYFYTTEDVMITIPDSVLYILSDAPQDVKTPPVIVYDKTSKPSSTGTR